jgi:hypothetical protein
VSRRRITLTLTPAQAEALRVALMIADDMAQESDLVSVRRDARTLLPVREQIRAALGPRVAVDPETPR